MSEVLEAIVIGQEWEGDVRVVLFVKLQPGTALDDALVARIKGDVYKRQAWISEVLERRPASKVSLAKIGARSISRS